VLKILDWKRGHVKSNMWKQYQICGEIKYVKRISDDNLLYATEICIKGELMKLKNQKDKKGQWDMHTKSSSSSWLPPLSRFSRRILFSSSSWAHRSFAKARSALTVFNSRRSSFALAAIAIETCDKQKCKQRILWRKSRYITEAGKWYQLGTMLGIIQS